MNVFHSYPWGACLFKGGAAEGILPPPSPLEMGADNIFSARKEISSLLDQYPSVL